MICVYTIGAIHLDISIIGYILSRIVVQPIIHTEKPHRKLMYFNLCLTEILCIIFKEVNEMRMTKDIVNDFNGGNGDGHPKIHYDICMTLDLSLAIALLLMVMLLKLDTLVCITSPREYYSSISIIQVKKVIASLWIISITIGILDATIPEIRYGLTCALIITALHYIILSFFVSSAILFKVPSDEEISNSGTTNDERNIRKKDYCMIPGVVTIVFSFLLLCRYIISEFV